MGVGAVLNLPAGATIKVRSNAGNRGATLAKRIISEVEVSLLIRAATSKRDRVLLEVIYAGGLRVSETVALTWADVLARDERVQLSITGKGGKVRQVLLPELVSRALLSLRGDARNDDPLFPSCMGGGKLTERNVNAMVKRASCDRPWCFAARGSEHAGPRQHRHHVGLSARPTRQVERIAPRSWGFLR